MLARIACLKCLSAFGFWGTRSRCRQATRHHSRLKCLSAFGFWGTNTSVSANPPSTPCLKCLSAFGFWGTSSLAKSKIFHFWVSNAFRLLGSGELWREMRITNLRKSVSNAFRLLGSGEPPSLARDAGSFLGLKCLSAFGFWGTEYYNRNEMAQKLRLKCLSAFGFWGTRSESLKRKD